MRYHESYWYNTNGYFTIYNLQHFLVLGFGRCSSRRVCRGGPGRFSFKLTKAFPPAFVWWLDMRWLTSAGSRAAETWKGSGCNGVLRDDGFLSFHWKRGAFFTSRPRSLRLVLRGLPPSNALACLRCRFRSWQDGSTELRANSQPWRSLPIFSGCHEAGLIAEERIGTRAAGKGSRTAPFFSAVEQGAFPALKHVGKGDRTLL